MDRTPWLYRASRGAAALAMRVLRGIRAEGLEHVPESGGVIVAVNHRSLIDPPLVSAVLFPPRYPRFLAKRELFRIPFFGEWMRAIGAIELDRSRGDMGAIREALSVLGSEGCLVLFPEGTRSKDGLPLRPKAGVGFLAREARCPVVPARVRATESIFRSGPLFIRFGPPLRFEGGEGRRDCQTFAERVMEAILSL
jgi:1-acyl-sn-glycerol-3-phosphate acyltransferase